MAVARRRRSSLRVRLAIPGLFLVVAVLLVPSFRLSAGRVVGRDEPRGARPLRRSLVAGAALVAGVAAARATCGPADAARPRRPGPRRRHDRPVARRPHRPLRPGVADAVPVRRRRRLRHRQGLRRRQRRSACCSAASSPPALGASSRCPPCACAGLHLALSTFGIALIGREVILGDPRVFGLGGLSRRPAGGARLLDRLRRRLRRLVRGRVRRPRRRSSASCAAAGSAASSPPSATASWRRPRSACGSGRRRWSIFAFSGVHRRVRRRALRRALAAPSRAPSSIRSTAS